MMTVLRRCFLVSKPIVSGESAVEGVESCVVSTRVGVPPQEPVPGEVGRDVLGGVLRKS